MKEAKRKKELADLQRVATEKAFHENINEAVLTCVPNAKLKATIVRTLASSWQVSEHIS